MFHTPAFVHQPEKSGVFENTLLWTQHTFAGVFRNAVFNAPTLKIPSSSYLHLKYD